MSSGWNTSPTRNTRRPSAVNNNIAKAKGGATMKRATGLMLIGCAAVAAIGFGAAQAQNAMTFFVTSAGPGKGADLGGLEGADRHCPAPAQGAGPGGKTADPFLP